MMRRASVLGVVGMVVGMLCAGAWAELSPERMKEAEALIGQFGSPDFGARQEAVDRLVEMGRDVGPLVEKALAETEDEEVRMRCEMVLRGIAGKKEPAPVGLVERVVKSLGEANSSVRYSPDGTRSASVMDRGRVLAVLCDGFMGPEYDRIGNCRFSPDSRKLAYQAGYRGVWFMVVDGVEGMKYRAVGIPVFSPDSRKIAYWAVKEDKECVVEDDTPGTMYDEVQRTPVFSGDSLRVAYGARRGDKWFVVCEGKELGGYDEVGTPVFSREGRLAYRARQGERTFVVSDGAEGRKYLSVNGEAVFSPDGTRMGYSAKREDGAWCVVINGEEFGRYAGGAADIGPRGLVFSGAGRHTAWVIWRKGKWAVTVDGKEEEQGFAKVSELVFSPDGEHLAYMGRRGGSWVAMCDGMEGGSYPTYGEQMVWSADSRHLAYVVQERDWRIVVDGMAGADHWMVTITGDYAKNTGVLRYNMRDRDGARLMEVEWPKEGDWRKGFKPVEGK